jgi:uncharacterized membrane-anchored protein
MPVPTVPPAGREILPTQTAGLQDTLRESAFARERRTEATSIAERANADAAQQARSDLDSRAQAFFDPKNTQERASRDRLIDDLGPFAQHLAKARTLERQLSDAMTAGIPSDHPVIQSKTREIHQELLAAQSQAQLFGFSLEAAGKVIDSATNGVRTVLQTQT